MQFGLQFCTKTSTDEEPQHKHCRASWCSWQQAKTTGTFRLSTQTACLSRCLRCSNLFIEDLSRNDLLTRCLGGYMQNSNDNLNAVVWSLAPKSRFNDNWWQQILNICMYIAVCVFNDGFKSLLKIMEVMNIIIGTSSYNFMMSVDDNWINRRAQDAAKEAILMAKSLRHETEEDTLNADLLYGFGIVA